LTDGRKKEEPWLRRSDHASSLYLAFLMTPAAELFPRYRHFFSDGALNSPEAAAGIPHRVHSDGISMSGEISYLSRFFVKFVEIIAAGLASAISAYLLAHFWGVLLSSPTPASAPLAPTASEVAESLRAQPTPPVAAAANERRPAPQQNTDAPAAQPAPKAGKDAKAVPPRRHTKPNASIAEKEPRGQKSVEALVRDALANVDANRLTSADALIGPGLTDTRSAPVDPLPRSISVPQIVPPQPPPPADQDKDVFSALKRIPDLLRPDPPAVTGEAPRPPMPVGTPPE
jgi:hypothetical protein